MSDEIPVTHEEVQKLVEQAPSPKQTIALVNAVTDGPCKVKPDDVKTRFAKWVSAACFMIVVVIAFASVLQQKNDALDRSVRSDARAECRASVAGELNIARAESGIVGNNYQAILGQILVDAIQRTNTDEFAAQAIELEKATEALRVVAQQATAAIDRQSHILEICADGNSDS